MIANMAQHGPRRLLVVWMLAASVASAEPRDPAAAELLFREARKALDAGRTEEACTKFAESHRLDPAAGTLINLAACEEKLGRLASAWEKWQRALRMLPADDERRAGVEKRADAIEAKLPKLEIRLAPGAPPDTQVLRDGIELGPASLGLALPVDPGEHRVEARAKGREARISTVTVAEKESKTLEVEPGPALPAAEKPAPKPAPAPAPPPPTRDQAPPSEGGSSTLGWIALGVGATGVVVGSVFGALALSKKGEMEDDCDDVDGTPRCGASGLDAADSGNTYATVSTVAFGVGIVGLGVGGWLLLTSDDSGPKTAIGARALPGGAALGVAGAF